MNNSLSVVGMMGMSNSAQEYAKLVAEECKTESDGNKVAVIKKLEYCRCKLALLEGMGQEKQAMFLEDVMESASGNEVQLKTSLEAIHKDKKKTLGQKAAANIFLIGELFKADVLTPKIIKEYVTALFKDDSDSANEENLFKLCLLFTLVGRKLENDLKKIVEEPKEKKAKEDNSDESSAVSDSDEDVVDEATEPSAKWISKCFSKLKDLCKDSDLSAELRLFMVEVLELRNNKWMPDGFPNSLEVEYVNLQGPRKRGNDGNLKEADNLLKLSEQSLRKTGSSRLGRIIACKSTGGRPPRRTSALQSCCRKSCGGMGD